MGDNKIDRIGILLEKEYGRKEWVTHGDPLSELIGTILSQNTSDKNSHRAFENLRRRFKDWEEVRNASLGEIREAIKVGGLAQIKAKRIKDILNEILARQGSLDLWFLADLSIKEARDYLLSFEGVGPKTAACVLLFALGKPSLPVDTHINRVSKRLGLIGGKVGADKAHNLLQEMIPDEDIYSFHLNMIAHGRRICHSRSPLCNECVLAEECDYFST